MPPLWPDLRSHTFQQLVLLTVLAWLSVACSPVPAAAAPETLVTEADLVEVELAQERTHAQGQAHLWYGDFELSADELSADRTTGAVEATGHLRVVQRARQLTGDSLNYNLLTGVGSLKHARVIEQGVVVTGDELTLAPDKIVAHNALFTTCNEPVPHYAFAAGEITLTAQQVTPGQPPRSGRLSLNHARLLYHGRPLFSLPRYSVSVGDIGKKQSTPLPTTGWSRADGPFTTFSYSLGQPTTRLYGGLTYRYTTFRGIRGAMSLNAPLGPSSLTFGYYRRQDPGDRDIEPDDLEATSASVLVNREPEYGVIMPERRLRRSLSLQASLLAGSYSEYLRDGIVKRAAADRTSLNLILRTAPYRLSPSVELSHALGWRWSDYSTGDDYRVLLYRHSIALRLSPRLRLEFSHVTRRDSGQTPFLFDGILFRREIVGELDWTVNSAWRLRFADYYDPEANRARDMIVEATRTAHCLEYTLGWRKERGTFYIGFGLAPPAAGLGAVPSPQPPGPSP
ncbi:MAG: hypothetical protein ACE149_01425 [Armatimonadota bacterium]